MTATTTPAADRSRPIDRGTWLALSVVIGATVMVALDTTIVNVALHAIGEDVGGGGVEWVVTAYLLAVCAAQPSTGWLADRFGRPATFTAALVTFTAASAACGASTGLPMLVVARVLQGLGGGTLLPVGMAIVFELFPRDRHGRAMGIWGTATMFAPAIGPTLGGWLVTSMSWHWLFLVNVPIGLAVLVAARRFLPTTGVRHAHRFDGPGLLLGSGGLTIAILGLSQGHSWRWTSPATVATLVVGVLLLVAFVRWERSAPQPMIDLRLFEERGFGLAIVVMTLTTFAQFGRLVFLPLALESLRDKTPLAVGLLFLPSSLVTAAAMNVGGRLSDRVGPRKPIMAGCVLMLIAMVGLSQLTLTTPMWAIALVMCVQGLGLGAMTPSLLVAGLSAMPATLTAQATAVRSLFSQVAGVVAVAVLGAVISAASGADPARQALQDAYGLAFLVAAGSVLVGLILATRLPNRPVHSDAAAHALIAE